MRRHYLLCVVFIISTGITMAHAQESSVLSVILRPAQTSFVKGDLNKFRAITGINDGSASGIKEAVLDAKAGKDVHIFFEGRGMVGDADYEGRMLLTKNDVGYVKFNYSSLRKYYDNQGGYYAGVTGKDYLTGQNLQLVTLNKELAMDIGHFAVELGRGMPGDSSLNFAYERDTRNGSKSKLTWAAIQGSVVNRKFAPAYSDMDTVTDTLTIKGKTKLSGFDLQGEQKVVLYDAHILENAQMRSINSTASQNYINGHDTRIDAKEYLTTARAERWSLNDKTYFALAYRFAHLGNDTYLLHQQLLGATGAFYARNDEWVDSRKDVNIWTAQLFSNVTEKFSVNSRFKTEVSTINSVSARDTNTAVNAISLARDSNNADVINTSEGISLRYTGIAKASLYGDADLKQERYNRVLTYSSGTTSPYTFNALETLNHIPEGKGKVGIRFVPVKNVNITTEYAHAAKKDKLERFNIIGSQLSNDGAMGIFRTDKDEVNSRVAWKPVSWLENSLKVSEASTVYHVKALQYDLSRTPAGERNFIYDMTLMPDDKWMFNLAYSLKFVKVEPRGNSIATVPPVSTADVYGYSFTTSYAPVEKFSVFNTLGYSRAKNKTNADNPAALGASATAATLLGLNDAWWDIDTGAKWEAGKNVTIEPHYAYYAYRAYPGVETGNYSAHVVWLDVNIKW
ncbi:MAG: hypothetical protein WCI27_07960 [Candidatus Omnitrophota bacterium]